jgi:uncharacterized coiled-coil DUF342 family protein
MPRASPASDKRSLELTEHKEKIRKQRDEIINLKKTIRTLRQKLKDFAA